VANSQIGLNSGIFLDFDTMPAWVLPKINFSSGCEYSEFFTLALELILRSGADGAGPVAAHKRSLPTSPCD
jgi:hypothetical protein